MCISEIVTLCLKVQFLVKAPVPLDTSLKMSFAETLAKHGIALREYQQSLGVQNKER